MFGGIMDYFFGPPLTVEDQIKEINRIMDQSIKDIKREIMTTKHEKTRAIKDLRVKAAQSNKTSSKELKQLAVRIRRHENQLSKLESTIDKINGFKSMATQLRTNEALGRSFTKMTQAITMLNATTNTFQLCALVNQYERQNLLMQEKQEFIDNIIEEAYEDSEDEEQMADNILDEVLDELNIKLTGDLPDTGTTKVTQTTTTREKGNEEESKKEKKETEGGNEDDVLASRIMNLK